MEAYKTISESSTVVDALARMLCGNSGVEVVPAPVEKSFLRGAKMALEEFSTESLFTFRAMDPSRAFTFDPVDPDRLYAVHSEGLVRDVDETIGDQAETLALDGDTLKWVGVRRAYKLPRGLCMLTKCRTMYELHYRRLDSTGCVEYVRSMVGVSSGGKPVPVLVQGARGRSSAMSDPELLVAVASVMEDAHRANTVTAEFTDGATILMPVGLEDYQELFRLRDAPMSASGRRKSILHWVASHKRRKKEGSTTVSEHLRGVHEFVVDGLKVRLSPNQKV